MKINKVFVVLCLFILTSVGVLGITTVDSFSVDTIETESARFLISLNQSEACTLWGSTDNSTWTNWSSHPTAENHIFNIYGLVGETTYYYKMNESGYSTDGTAFTTDSYKISGIARILTPLITLIFMVLYFVWVFPLLQSKGVFKSFKDVIIITLMYAICVIVLNAVVLSVLSS